MPGRAAKNILKHADKFDSIAKETREENQRFAEEAEESLASIAKVLGVPYRPTRSAGFAMGRSTR